MAKNFSDLKTALSRLIQSGSTVPVFLRRLMRSVLFVVVFFSLAFYVRTSWLHQYTQKKIELARITGESTVNLFQSSYYFYYDEQFKPAIQDLFKNNPDLKQLSLISSAGEVVFDSKSIDKKISPYHADISLISRKEEVVNEKMGVSVFLDVAQYKVYLLFEDQQLAKKIYLLFFLAFIGGLAFSYIFTLIERRFSLNKLNVLNFNFKKISLYQDLSIYSLRTKFILLLITLNIVTGSIVYFFQINLQRREEGQRILRTSILLSELSKESVVSSFSNFYYFYYQEKFIPAIRYILSSNENLTKIRLISRKTGFVVFDTDEMNLNKGPAKNIEGKKADLPADVLSELQDRDSVHRVVQESGHPHSIQVISAYKSETQESPFWVEYIFSFYSLEDAIRKIKKQILIELIPGTLLSIVISILFSQLLIGPIRKLLFATKAITSGNYDVNFDAPTKDEFGELMKSFNVMALELKRKNELKKYLSANSYRKITESQDGFSNSGGARMNATVLFCDVRNFVNVCEMLEAEEVTSLLNEYFSAMVEVIYRHKGEVDKFIGDAILAVFYDREDTQQQPINTALHAIYCAMEMRERLVEFNEKRSKNNQNTIEIGIGISHGEIISGPIGSADRRDFTVIGDVVNLANRIEKISKKGKHTRIVFSNHVEERVRGLLEYEKLSEEKIRGKEEAVVVYELLRIKDVNELLKNLHHDDLSIRRHCIDLLGYSRNESALESLYGLLDDPSDHIRTSAVTAIIRLSPKHHMRTVEVLFERIEKEKSQRVLSNLLIGIGKICKSTDEILRVANFLQSPDERIVANTIEALANSDDPRVIDLLIPFVVSKNNRVKANASMVLFSKGRSEVLDTLKPMLLHSDPLMRASAAFALGELTVMASAEGLAERLRATPEYAKQFLAELQGCVPMLVSLLRDSDLTVKRNAIIALGKMKDKSAVLPLIDHLNIDEKDITHEVALALRSIGSHRLVREVIQQMS